MKDDARTLFAPLRMEPLALRLSREFMFTVDELRLDPRGYLRGAFSKDDYDRKRIRLLYLGATVVVVTLSLAIGISILVKYLRPSPDIALISKVQGSVIDMPLPNVEIPAPPKANKAGGGGGGGRNEQLPPSRGRLPQASLQPPLIDPSPHPPTVPNPSLPTLPTVQAQPELIPQQPSNIPFGDPSSLSTVPSAGPGSGGGIGTGKGGGVGSGSGTGVGPGEGWNTGGGRPSIGGGTGARSKPQLLNNPRPDWTEEARKNRIQGRVVLRVTFGRDGAVHNIEVLRGLGYGLDEKAIEAAKMIRFEPARDLNGRPIDYRSIVHVDFNLL
ncbi:MAG: TonB family protein [Acidobacteria bacterium]|nr:TonB family protein [Acidobacteriota bacterium]